MEEAVFYRILNALLLNGSYNATLVSMAVSLQGVMAGLLGCHLIARRQVLLADVLSHAALPGVGVGFLVMLIFFDSEHPGREFFVTGGAFAFMLICLLFIHFMNRSIKADAVFALSLSGFYGLGIVLLSYIQTIPSGAKAGLETFILGQSATVNITDVKMIISVTLLTLGVYALLHRKWMVVCFDASFARISGVRIGVQDFTMLILAILSISIGIRAMGLILIVALFTIPPLVAGLLCRRWYPMLLCSGAIGAVASHTGVSITAGLVDVPSGVCVVLVCAFFYALALGFSQRKNFFQSLLYVVERLSTR